jgi:flagellar biosynthesis GTPase FlhF
MSMSMKGSMMSSMERMLTEACERTIAACAEKYGFSKEEASRELKIELLDKEKVVKEKVVKEKVVKEKVVKERRIPLPFIGEKIEGCCEGLCSAYGLYNQCRNKKEEGKLLCKKCEKEKECGDLCGTMDERIEGGESFRGKKGVRPSNYKKVMEKQGWSKEEVIGEGLKVGIVIREEYLSVEYWKRGRPKKEVSSVTSSSEKKRGRPKKEEKKVEVNVTEDLFSSLMTEAISATICEDKDKEKENEEMSDLSDEDSMVSEKKEKEKEKKERNEMKEAEKESKEAGKKAKEEAKKAAKEAKKAEKEAAKEAKKAGKVSKKVEKKEESSISSSSEVEEEVKEKTVTVKKFTHEGVTYLRSSENILYDLKTQEVIGMWNESTQKIDECELEEEEEEED